MNIVLYNFSKRKNSTKVPTGGTSVNCQLKDDTSIYNPSFIISTKVATDYTYVSWDGRYYYIDDTVINNADHTYTLSCSLDPLATAKSDINNTSAYVLYSSSNYCTNIVDGRISRAGNVCKKTTTDSTLNYEVGCYFCSVINNQNYNSFILESGQNLQLIHKTMDDDLIASLIYNAGDYIAKKVDSANNTIAQLHYLPIRAAYGSSDSVQIILGNGYGTGIYAHPATHTTTWTITMSIPWQYSDYRNHNACTSLTIYLPAYGVAELNADDFYGESSLTINVGLDAFNGELVYRIGNLYRFSTNIAVPINISQVVNSPNSAFNMLAGLGMAVGGAFVGDYGSVATTVAGLFNATKSALSRQTGSVGSNGGASGYYTGKNIILQTLTHDSNITPDSVLSSIGRPCNSVQSMGSLTGYVQTVNFSVNSNLPDNIKENINNMMDGGIYLE